MLLAPLKGFPLGRDITPADPEMMDLCLAWHKGPGKGVEARVKELRDRMTADDPFERDEASEELEAYAGENPQALRAVVERVETEADAEVKARFMAVSAAGKELAAAIRYVAQSKLHRDLEYLGALLESGDRAEAARGRLEALTGRNFGTRADFEAWHAEHGAKLIWDRDAGRYREGK